MWEPKFQIRPRLLSIMREIGETLGAINAQKLAEPKLAKLSLDAKTLSSYASTSIEGNPLPLTDVKRLLKTKPNQIRDAEREVLNYNRALEWLQERLVSGEFALNAETYTKLQGMVTHGLMQNPFDIGHIRQKPVVIRDPRHMDRIVFMPPSHKDVPQLLDDLFAFLNANLDKLDPILLAGLFHKQAVIIHPYMDGNGRSTRLMTTAILGMTGLDIFPIFSFEAYYNRNVTRYFSLVGEQGDYYDLVHTLDFSDWLEYFADGILDELKRVQKTLPDKSIRLEAHHRQILDYLDSHGTINQQDLAHISLRSLASRKKDLTYLLERGLIKAMRSGRSRYYVLASQD